MYCEWEMRDSLDRLSHCAFKPVLVSFSDPLKIEITSGQINSKINYKRHTKNETEWMNEWASGAGNVICR